MPRQHPPPSLLTLSSISWFRIISHTEADWGGSAVEFARWHVGIGVGVGLIVAVGREILLRVWPSLYEATQTSNRQVTGGRRGEGDGECVCVCACACVRACVCVLMLIFIYIRLREYNSNDIYTCVNM